MGLLVALELVSGALATSDIPDNDAPVEATGE